MHGWMRNERIPLIKMIRAVLCLARCRWDEADGEMFFNRSGLVQGSAPADASLMSACDPMGSGWDEKLKHIVSIADGVRDIARGTGIDCTLLAEKIHG